MFEDPRKALCRKNAQQHTPIYMVAFDQLRILPCGPYETDVVIIIKRTIRTSIYFQIQS